MTGVDMTYVITAAIFSLRNRGLRQRGVGNVAQRLAWIYTAAGYGSGRATILKPRS